MPSVKKIEAVKQLTDKIKSAKSIVLMDYRGVSAQDENKLRKMVNSETGAEYLIAKNRLFKIALKDSGLGVEMDSALIGPTSFLFSYDDAILAPKLSKEFGKDRKDIFKIKCGIMESKFVDAATVAEISNLPSREVLISKLLAQMKSPIQRLHTSLKFNLDKLSQVLKSISANK